MCDSMICTPPNKLSRRPRSPPVVKRPLPTELSSETIMRKLRTVEKRLEELLDENNAAAGRLAELKEIADAASADYHVTAQENALLRRMLDDAHRATLDEFKITCAAACCDECSSGDGAVRLFELDCGGRHYLCANALARIVGHRCPLCRGAYSRVRADNAVLEPATWRAPVPSDGDAYAEWVNSGEFAEDPAADESHPPLVRSSAQEEI